MSDRIFAIFWLGVCALIVVQMLTLSVPFAYEPVGPKTFPILLAVLMALSSLALLIRPERSLRRPDLRLLGKGVALIAIFLLYAMFFETLGFPLATAAMALGVNRLFGGRWWTGLLTAILIAFGGYFLFDRILEVSLPAGRIGPWT